MTDEALDRLIETYLDEEWETVVADIDALVRIESTEDKAGASADAPFGPGVRRALDAALGIAERMGFATGDAGGCVGFADVPDASERQIAMICHVDVVPAGQGWTVEPFAVTRREGWLMGRGVLDDKGPAMVALHAMNCLRRAGVQLPCSVRMLFGTNEESGMHDVPRYLAEHEAPAFLFTPDADFPVGYGEKGQLDGEVRFPVQPDGALVELAGGMATNAVPSEASALVRADAASLPTAEGVVVEAAGEGLARVSAEGVGGHAAWPENTRSAVGVLADYLLEAGVGTDAERAFLQLASTVAYDVHGEELGIAASDEHFGPLTIIGGTLRTEPAEDACGQGMAEGAGGQDVAESAGERVAAEHAATFVLTTDSRFPTTTSAERIVMALAERAHQAGAAFVQTATKSVFLTDPASPAIQALLASYREVFDDDAQPFTMGGGTYARCFPVGASFGPNRPWAEERPAWAGEEHMADEAVREDVLKDAFRVYVRTLCRLARIEW